MARGDATLSLLMANLHRYVGINNNLKANMNATQYSATVCTLIDLAVANKSFLMITTNEVQKIELVRKFIYLIGPTAVYMYTTLYFNKEDVLHLIADRNGFQVVV